AAAVGAIAASDRERQAGHFRPAIRGKGRERPAGRLRTRIAVPMAAFGRDTEQWGSRAAGYCADVVSFAAVTKRRTLSISLPSPSARSVLVFESTPAGRTAAIAAATLSASRPPA